MKRSFSVLHDRPGKLQKTAVRKLPLLHGPLHDAHYIDSLHPPNRPSLKPSLIDNPKSPIANFAALESIPLHYNFSDLFDPAANKRIIRSVLSLHILSPLTLPTAVPFNSTPTLKSSP